MTDKHIPMRRCIACMKSYPQNSLIRLSFYGDSLSIDSDGKKKGRGAYICNNPYCIENSKKKRSFNRAFKHVFTDEEIDNIVTEIINDKKGGI